MSTMTLSDLSMSPAAANICIFLQESGVDIVEAETSQESDGEDLCDLELVDKQWMHGYRFLAIWEPFNREYVTIQLMRPGKYETTWGTLQHVKEFLKARMVPAPTGVPLSADVPHHLQSIMQLLDTRVSTLETQLCE